MKKWMMTSRAFTIRHGIQMTAEALYSSNS